MKKSFKVLCLMLVAFMMSGCMKFNMNMDINSDKSMNLELIVAFANEMMGSSNETNMDNSEIQKLKDNGFNVEEYSDDTMTGYTISTKINNIDDVSTEKDTMFNLNDIFNGEKLSDIFTVKKGFFKNTYTVKIGEEESTDMTNELEDDLNSTYSDDSLLATDDADLSMLLNSMDINFTINLPYKAISSNATNTENDGKTLVWQPTSASNSSSNIEFSFELYNMTNIYLMVGIVILIIVIIIILIVKHCKKTKSNKSSLNSQKNDSTLNNETVVTHVTPTTEPSNPTNIQTNTISNLNNETLITTPVQEAAPVASTPESTTPVQEVAPVETIVPTEATVAQVEPLTSAPQPNTPKPLQENQNTVEIAKDLNFQVEVENEFQCLAKIRYSAKEAKAVARKENDGVIVEFIEPQRAITKGQSVVFYDEEGIVLGGGVIS